MKEDGDAENDDVARLLAAAERALRGVTATSDDGELLVELDVPEPASAPPSEGDVLIERFRQTERTRRSTP